jgi:DNA-binding PadR family transcriptional regulator
MVLSSARPGRTTTSYAILGLLAIRPWTTYELVRQMGRSLGRLWPRAESKIYEEPRKLVAAGLARASTGSVGRRPRTTYSITAKGRRALAAWLAEPGASPPSLESEHLLKLFFAEHGTTRDAIATVEALRDWALLQRSVHLQFARDYLSGQGQFQERFAVNSLTGRFLIDFNDMLLAWCERTLDVLNRWPDDPSQAQPDTGMLAELVRLAGDLPDEGVPARVDSDRRTTGREGFRSQT